MKLSDVHDRAAKCPSKFQVIREDNYHYQDDDYRRSMGMFDTYEEALAVAVEIVTESVQECAEGKESADEILAAYKSFGDDAWIMPTPEGVERFSAWTFAGSMANELRG